MPPMALLHVAPVSSIPANPNLSSRPSCLLQTSFLQPQGLHSSLSFSSNRYGLRGSGSCRRDNNLRNCGARALFGLGVPELAVIAGVTALIFGPSKLPEIGKSLGKTVKSFQQAAKEFESEVKQGGDSVTTDPSKSEVISSSPGQEKENADL